MVFAIPSKGKECHKTFAPHLKEHRGNPEDVVEVVCYMPPAFLKAAKTTFRRAMVTEDWFHMLLILTKARDEVLRLEIKQVKLPGGTRWAVRNSWRQGAATRRLLL